MPRYIAGDRLALATNDTAMRQGFESARLRYDDGRSGLRRKERRENECYQPVRGWTAIGLEARLRMQQEYRESGLNGFWTNAATEALDVETKRLRCDDGVRPPAARRSREIAAGHGAGAELPTSDRAMGHDPQKHEHCRVKHSYSDLRRVR